MVALMNEVHLSTTILLIVLGLVFLVIPRQRARRGSQPLPGPRGWPLVGNTFQIPTHPQEQVRKWTAQYGKVFSLSIAGYEWVMISELQVAKAIMEKQAMITSSRIPLPVLSDQISGGYRLALMPYNNLWRQMRSLVHKLTTPKASDSLRPSQEYEAKQLVHDILTDNVSGGDFYNHVRRYTTSVIMTATYGKRIPAWENDTVAQVYDVMKDFAENGPPTVHLGDIFPILTKLPLWMQPWANLARQLYKKQEDLWTRLYNELVRNIQSGVAPDCFVKGLCENEFKKKGISDTQAAFLSGSMIGAGSETTAATINTALKYLALNPHVQGMANETLTRIVGESRTPSFTDFDSLLYIRAIFRETMRLQPVISMGVTHFTTADVAHEDYFIPANTAVTLNVQAVHFDERHERPFEFCPERFMHNSHRVGPASLLPDLADRDHFSWGIGRRICPGMHIAENSLYITLAKILWAFEILPPTDHSGNEEPVDISSNAFEERNFVLPKPFRLRFVPRSVEREKIILAEWAEAKEEGYWLGPVKVSVEGMLSKEIP